MGERKKRQAAASTSTFDLVLFTSWLPNHPCLTSPRQEPSPAGQGLLPRPERLPQQGPVRRHAEEVALARGRGRPGTGGGTRGEEGAPGGAGRRRRPSRLRTADRAPRLTRRGFILCGFGEPLRSTRGNTRERYHRLTSFPLFHSLFRSNRSPNPAGLAPSASPPPTTTTPPRRTGSSLRRRGGSGGPAAFRRTKRK